MDELTAIGRARKLIEGCDAAPVDAFAIAASLGFEVKEADLPADQAGNTFELGGRKIICTNRNDDPYRQRFTIFHEIGHHVLDLPSQHGSALLAGELERFTGRPPEEKLCDAFAAACLVPLHLIRPLAADMTFSVETVRKLTELFEASHQCIASSFVRASRELLAYVYAEQGRIQRVIPSSALRDAKIYVESGCRVPDGSAAALTLENGSREETAELDGSDWSNSDAANNCACYEEALHMQAWQQTHSFVTFEVVGRPSSNQASSIEDDERLPELTGHLPWPSR